MGVFPSIPCMSLHFHLYDTQANPLENGVNRGERTTKAKDQFQGIQYTNSKKLYPPHKNIFLKKWGWGEILEKKKGGKIFENGEG